MQETGDRRQKTGDRRQESGVRIQETGDGRQEIDCFETKFLAMTTKWILDNRVREWLRGCRINLLGDPLF